VQQAHVIIASKQASEHGRQDTVTLILGACYSGVGKAGDDGVLGLELGLPVGEDAELLVGEPGEVPGDVGLFLGHLAERAGGLAAGEHGVGAAGAVEAAAGGDVVDLPADGEVDRLGGVDAVVRPQLRRRQLRRHRERGGGARCVRWAKGKGIWVTAAS
jgi:hypothetical protein